MLLVSWSYFYLGGSLGLTVGLTIGATMLIAREIAVGLFE